MAVSLSVTSRTPVTRSSSTHPIGMARTRRSSTRSSSASSTPWYDYHSWWYADNYVTGPRVYVGGSGLKVQQSWSSGGKASAKARYWDVDEVAQSAAVNV